MLLWGCDQASSEAPSMNLRTRRAKKQLPWQVKLPDLLVLLKYEMGSCSDTEVKKMCQELIDSGRLQDFAHPIRRTCYDLAATGFVNNLMVPSGYLEATMDPDRLIKLHITVQ